MKHLGLLRHAKSDWGESDRRDFDRGLNDRGRRGGRLIGEHIRARAIQWQKIVASSAERVQRTLEQAMPGTDVVFDERLYLASVETIREVIGETSDAVDALLIAGHNPGLQDMVLTFVAPDEEDALFNEAKVKFPTASFAVIEFPIDSWAALTSESGKLLHFARPRDLDPALGPED